MYRKLVLLTFLIVVFGCDKDKEPRYSVVPHIKFVDVEFGAYSDLSQLQLFKITFSYTDEDGDIGFRDNEPQHVADPYHHRFYVSKLNGEKISSDRVERGEVPVESLISYNDRSTPPYDTLPELNCSNYFIFSQDVSLYQIKNYNHYNLLVDFLVENQDGEFKKFDWYGISPFPRCYFEFHARLPPLGTGTFEPFDVKVFSPRRGEITYNMLSSGFNILFADKRIKLSVTILDRALNRSNTIETPAFYLKDI